MNPNDEHEIIDAEIVDIPNLPAVVQTHQHSEPITKWSEQWWNAASPEVQANRCRAHKKTGERCRNAAILGATVCRFHGGAAKHVKAAARARLENATDLMAQQLLGIALTAGSESVKLAAIRDALDRGGLKAPSEVVLSQGQTKPYEAVFDSIGGSPSGTSESMGEGRSWEDSDGDHASPASAYDQSAHQPAGSMPDGYDPSVATGYEDMRPEYVGRQEDPPYTAEDSEPLGRASARQGPRRERDHQRQPELPVRHITGETAIRFANAANRQIGALPPLPELESPHRRHRRP